MRVMVILAAVSMLMVGGCKKDKGNSVVDAAAAATTPVSIAAAQAGGANCPACPAAPACPPPPECPVCAAPDAVSKVALGADATALKVFAPPGFGFTVEKAAEYQIDATASENDPELRLYKGDEQIATDSDSGGERNARIYAFLAPGDYVARVTEYNFRPVETKVKVAQAPALTSAGALTVGGELEVTMVEGTPEARNVQEATLEITAAGKYRIDAPAGEDVDPVLTLIRDNAVVDQNDDFDSSVDRSARIERDLEPGTYIVRVNEAHGSAGTVKLAASAVTP